MTSLHEIAKRAFPTVLLFLFLWGGIVFIDRVVIGSNYAQSAQDLETGWFSWMLNWQTGYPWLVWYSPATSSRILNGLISFFIDVDLSSQPVVDFVTLGIGLQGVLVIVCAIWFFWIADILRIVPWVRLILVVLFFSYPTFLHYAGHRGFYFELWLFGLPLGLTLCAVLQNGLRGSALGGAGCGFMLANYYPAASIIFLFLLVVCGREILKKNKSLRWKPIMPKGRTEHYLIALSALCFTAWIVGLLYPPSIPYSYVSANVALSNSWAIIVVVILTWFIFSYVILTLVRWIPSLDVFLLWLLLAFIISASVLLPWYWHGLFLASEKGVYLWDSISIIWSRMGSYPWYLVFWFFIGGLASVVLYLLWKCSQEKNNNNVGLLSVGIFALLGGFIGLLFGGSTPGVIPGVPERGLMVVGPFFAAGLVVIFQVVHLRWHFLLVALALISSGYVAADFYRAYVPVIEEAQIEGNTLDEAIDVFLQNQPTGKVVCVSEEYYSRYCATAYAYNRYRTSASNEKLPSRILFGGRVVSLNARMPDKYGNWDDSNSVIRSLLFPVEGPLLVVTSGGWFRNNLIEMFAAEGIDIMPFWRWWTSYRAKEGKSATNVAPGNMFIANLEISN